MPRRVRSFLSSRAADVTALARPEVMRLVPYVGGRSIDEMKREYGRRDFIKLASNENVLGPSARAKAALRRAIGETHLYPEQGYPALKAALAKRYRVKPDQVVLGDGSNEILVLASEAFLRPGDEAVIADPSFAVFAHAIEGAGARVVRVPLRDYRHDLPAMARAVTRRTRLVFVCNPNNPTGTAVSRRELDAFFRTLPGHLVVLLDEAYAEFATGGGFPDSLSYVRRGLRVLVTRTFAKLHGLAGLRIGYGLAPAPLAGVLERLRQPFNVSTLAYRAALAALADRGHERRTLAMARRGREELVRELRGMGLRPVPSQTNFVLVDVGTDGAAFAKGLERRGIIVRPLGHPALRRHVRITVGTPAQHRALFRAIRALLLQ